MTRLRRRLCAIADDRRPLLRPARGHGAGSRRHRSDAPALSGDGRRVAFLTQSAPRGQEAVAAVDLFVTDMSPGVSRKAGTVELTREGTSRDPAASGSIISVALSADGRRAAIVTPRTRFLLPALKLIGDPRAVPGANELYLVDLADGTTERAVRARDSGDAGDAVSAQISLSAGGDRVAFASAAENLYFGDTNQRTDVFVADRQAAAPPPLVGDEPPADPPAEAFEAPPRTDAQAHRVRAAAPEGQDPAGRASPGGRARDGEGARAAAGHRRAPARSRAHAGHRHQAGSKAGRMTIDVQIAARYRSRLRRARALDARAEVILTPTRGTALKREIAVRFSAPKSR